MVYKGYNRQQGKAVDKYVKKTYDTITVRGKKGFRENLQNHTALTGESVNAFICRAIEEAMERDRARIAELMRNDRKDGAE